jgi:hypothetical protein
MAQSKVDICNAALTMIGKKAITAPGPDGLQDKVTRTVYFLYDVSWEYVLGLMDWPFAREFKTLQKSSDDAPDGFSRYELPINCHVPVDLEPRNSSTSWEQVGSTIMVETDADTIGLWYVNKVTTVPKFSPSFTNLLIELLASRIATPLASEKDSKKLYEIFVMNMSLLMSVDAQIGNEYRHPDNDPDKDKFNN